MDPTIQELINKLGVEAGKQAIQAVIRQWEERKRRKLDAAKNKEIREVAASMIQPATMEDVREFSPTYQAVSRTIKKKAAAKRRPAVKLVHRPGARKVLAVKKKSPAKKVR